MMLSKVEEFGKRRNEDSSSGRLLRDIEEIGKALYLQKNPPKYLISPSDYRRELKTNNYVDNEDSTSLQKGKKSSSSVWSWKPLKALTHIRSHNKFNCCFFLRVHSIKGLPSNFNDLGMYVHWKRKDQVLQTCPARVSEGVAKFEETLMHRCSIYATKDRKYESKIFLLYASVVGASALDIGKYWLDLTKLLPHTFEENKMRSSVKWTTSFNLTGKAKGAILNVSFGFSLSDPDPSFQSGISFVKVPDLLLKGSEPSSMDDEVGDSYQMNNSNHALSHFSSPSIDINEVFPIRGLDQSITSLYNKIEDKDFNFNHEHLEPYQSQAGTSGGGSSGNESNDETEFTVIEQGIEYPSKVRSEIETFDVDEIIEIEKEEKMGSNSSGNLAKDDNEVDDGENNLCSQVQEPTIEVVEWVESSSSSSVDDDEKRFLEQEENFMKTELSKRGKMKKSLSFDDDVTIESVTNEFLNLLSFDQQGELSDSVSESESPRERLLREFEKDAIASGNPLFNHDDDEDDDDDDDVDLSQSLRSRRRNAGMLENLETKALMQQWGLHEMAFESSLSGGFGSPVYILPPDDPPELLPTILGKGLEPLSWDLLLNKAEIGENSFSFKRKVEEGSSGES